ncbi:hypothetical protein ACHAL6_09090 [Proteiniclasticum sp. C24MP]|uniref:hypothetical protein n=1 Tax=Proteiniclasticum sp. C24MP TaxID=3374101 RepID=UPI0037545237
MELLKKLKRKKEEKLYLLNLPEILEHLREEFQSVLPVEDTLKEEEADFILAFFHTQEEIKERLPLIMEKVHDDTLLWVSYPKKSSRKVTSDITRDKGWEVFGEYGYEPVSQISISEDYSALRFRPLKDIRSFRRNEKMILSEEGRKRISAEKKEKELDGR